MNDFESLLISALTESALAQTRLAKQIERQTMAIQELTMALTSDDEDYDDEPLAAVMNPRNG